MKSFYHLTNNLFSANKTLKGCYNLFKFAKDEAIFKLKN